MFRCFLLLALSTAPAMASPFIDYPDDTVPATGPIEIIVPPEDLERCRATFALVLTPVMPDADGNPVLALPAAEVTHPDVTCVVATS